MITIDPKLQPPGQDGTEHGTTPPIGGPHALHDGIEALANSQSPDVSDAAPETETSEVDIDDDAWLKRATEAFDQADDYFDNSVRPKLNDSIKAFHSIHPSDSPFAATTKHFTSKIYRPKTRTYLTKLQAAACAAFFTNPDVVSIEAENPSDKNEVVAAAVMKALMNYRLDKSIDTYKMILGGFQDAMVQGLVCYHAYWDTGNGKIHSDTGKFLTDKPCVDLIPIENVRFNAGGSWVNIVETSPYFIILRPMFVSDIKEEMESGFFKEVEDSLIEQACTDDGATTRTARAGGKSDPQGRSTKSVKDYAIVVVQEHIHRIEGKDWVFHTLNNKAMLTDPKPIEEVYFHGRRPFIIGACEIEAHEVYVESQPTIHRQVQDEINEIANQRLNNLKLAMNKKFVIRSESEIDLDALLRNQPGSAVYTKEPKEDVMPLETGDVTQTSYLEQERLDKDFDSLGGQFDPNVGLTGRSGNDRLGTMQMLNSNANAIVEYKLRTFCETAVKPLLRLLAIIEQHYETDDVVLSLAGQKANVFHQISQVTNETLQKELNVKINVGLNSTDPMFKQQKFWNTITQLVELSANPAARGLDMQEVAHESFGLIGYGDGDRFLNQQSNPQMTILMQENMMLKQKSAGLELKEQTKRDIAMMQVASRERIELAKLQHQGAEAMDDDQREMHDMLQKHENERQQLKQQQAEAAAKMQQPALGGKA